MNIIFVDLKLLLSLSLSVFVSALLCYFCSWMSAIVSNFVFNFNFCFVYRFLLVAFCVLLLNLSSTSGNNVFCILKIKSPWIYRKCDHISSLNPLKKYFKQQFIFEFLKIPISFYNEIYFCKIHLKFYSFQIHTILKIPHFTCIFHPNWRKERDEK